MLKLNNKGSSPLHIVLILVIVGLIAGVGYYVYSSQKKTNESLDNANSSLEQAAQANKEKKTETNDKTSSSSIPEGYQQYKSSTGIFTFNYPKDWSEVKSSMNEMTIAYVSPTGTDFPNVYVWTTALENSSCDQTDQTVKKVTVDGIEAKQFIKSTSAKALTTCVVKNGKVYHIVHGSTDKEYPEVYAEVLSSFKFL